MLRDLQKQELDYLGGVPEISPLRLKSVMEVSDGTRRLVLSGWSGIAYVNKWGIVSYLEPLGCVKGTCQAGPMGQSL